MTASRSENDDSEIDTPNEIASEPTRRHRWIEAGVPKGRSRRRAPQAIETVANLLARQRIPTLAITACAMVARLAPLAVPFILRFTLNPILDRHTKEFFGRIWSADELLGLLLGLSIAIALVRAVANFGYVSLSGRSGHRMVADLRKEMFNHILRLPISYSERRDTGKILLRFIGDSDALRLWISRTRPTVYVDIVMLAVICAAMVWIDWRLGAIAAATVPIVGAGIAFFAPRLRALTRSSRSLQADFTGHVQARIDAIETTKWFDSVSGFRQLTGKLANSIARRNAVRERVSAAISSLGEASLLLLLPPLIWFGIRRVWANELTPGDLVALAWLAIHLGAAMQRLSASIAIHEKAQVSLQRVVRLLARPSERGRSSNLKEFEAKGQSIEFTNVKFEKSDDPGVSMTLHGPGTCVLDKDVPFGMVFDVLMGFRKTQGGIVKLDGENTEKLNLPSIRASIGWIQARPVVFDATVGENILMAKPKSKCDDLERAISDLGISKPDFDAWLAKPAGPNGRNLDASEKYEIGLLRVALRRPRFIFVEALPVEEGGDVLQRVFAHWSKRSLIVIDGRVL